MDWKPVIAVCLFNVIVYVIPVLVPLVISAIILIVKKTKTDLDNKVVRWAVAEFVKLEKKRKDDKTFKGAIGEDLWNILKTKAFRIFGITEEQMESLRLSIAAKAEDVLMNNAFFGE